MSVHRIAALVAPSAAAGPTGYRMTAKNGTGEILLYDLVGGWLGGVTPQQFAADLKAMGPVKNIDLRINSEGGDVFDGRTIYSMLTQHPAKITTHVDGLAASIASLIAMAGDEILMADGSFMMIHCAWGGVIGNADDMQKRVDMLRAVDDTLVKTYASRTKRDPKAILQMMKDETWMPADQAVTDKFADKVCEPMKMAACVRDPSFYQHPPEALISRPNRDALLARIAAISKRTRGVPT